MSEPCISFMQTGLPFVGSRTRLEDRQPPSCRPVPRVGLAQPYTAFNRAQTVTPLADTLRASLLTNRDTVAPFRAAPLWPAVSGQPETVPSGVRRPASSIVTRPPCRTIR